MTAELKADLVEIGVDLDVTLARFMGMEAMYQKFLFRFPEDPNFGILCQAMEEKDRKKAFEAAHTVKGVAANLGLGHLQDSISIMTEILRGEDGEVTKEQMNRALADHEAVCTVIEKHRSLA